MHELDEASVHAIVTDPPYGIGFMGKEWDAPTIARAAAEDAATRKSLGPESASRPGRAQPRSSSAFGSPAHYAGPVRAGAEWQAWCLEWATEALRILKPGGHLLAFGGTRTYHRLACAVEDAGFEIRDSLIWLYGSGFPKSLDVSKAIDKAAGADGAWRQEDHPGRAGVRKREDSTSNFGQTDYGPEGNVRHVYEPETEEAQKWNGWGTALKPGHEPIVVARKPLIGTVAANIQAHGTGALNIDDCRIGTNGEQVQAQRAHRTGNFTTPLDHDGERPREYTTEGRWPSNVVLDEAAAEELDRQSGERPAGTAVNRNRQGTKPAEVYGEYQVPAPEDVTYGDTGGASRFYYCAKASRVERNAGLDGHPEAPSLKVDPTSAMARDGRRGSGQAANHHPTVKPIALMRWLVRLVTPPEGTVLDPFTGSGTTGAAAVLEGFNFIGIEREAEYATLAEARIEWWEQHRGREADEVLAESRRSEVERERMESMGQLGLLEGAA